MYIYFVMSANTAASLVTLVMYSWGDRLKVGRLAVMATPGVSDVHTWGSAKWYVCVCVCINYSYTMMYVQLNTKVRIKRRKNSNRLPD